VTLDTAIALFHGDTISSPDLLAEHSKAHQNRPDERQAVLGDFRFPAAAEERALTRFLTESPFSFSSGDSAGRRILGIHTPGDLPPEHQKEAVLAVGSFDPRFRVAEDSDPGLRLSRKGLGVRYVPEARAIHQLPPFTTPDLIRRAAVYGETQRALLRKHPALHPAMASLRAAIADEQSYI
jgi:Glycosyl transferase family group 2